MGEGKPAFLSKESAEALPYPGEAHDATPTFDDELRLPDVPELPPLTEERPPIGKGYYKGADMRRTLVANLHARGYTNNQIAKHLGYSASSVSNVLKHPNVVAEIAKARAELYSHEVVDVLKTAALDAALRLKRSIMDPKDRDGHDASKFVVEKVTGKATQAITHEHKLSEYTAIARQILESGEVIDVSPAALPAGPSEESTEPVEADRWAAFLGTNV